MLYGILGIQLFLQPQVVPYKEHSLNFKHMVPCIMIQC